MPRFGALERVEILAAILGGLWCGALFLPWFGMGGTEKADSSTRINMALGVETEASALPSADS